MNAPRPPPYNQPEPDNEDEDATKWPILWNGVQSGLIILALVLTITELILVVTNRELAQKALSVAKNANSVVTDQVS